MTRPTFDSDYPSNEDQPMSHRPCIIAAVDLDGRAPEVAEHAARLAAMSRADLIVAHVVDYKGGYESDHAPAQSPTLVRKAMIDHARASLVGLVHLLDLPVGRVEIVVEPGAVADTLLAMAGALHPVYVLAGRSRWGLLGSLAGFEEILTARTGCDLLVVPGAGETAVRSVTARLRHWLASDPGLPSKPAH
jgi:nucleotide-binding universal stress UspA family protein